tara:strand:- start:42 stop:1091 length:1050 start_codon:yes stop_codon:yes gene_type:complete
MAETIDHEEEVYKIQKDIEERHNRVFNTGRKHLSYAASIAKSFLPDSTSFQDVSEYLLDMKTGVKVGTKLGSKGGPKGAAAGAFIGGVGYPIGKRVVQEVLPTLDGVLEPVMRRFRGPKVALAGADGSMMSISKGGDILQSTTKSPSKIIGAKDLPKNIATNYRNKLKNYLKEHGKLVGHTKDPKVGYLEYKGQRFRGKLNTPTSVKIKPDLAGKAEALKRKQSIFMQTVSEGDIKTFKGGHHKFEIDLGTSITDGMDPDQIKPFWKLVQRSMPNIFPGNHPKNIQKFTDKFTPKLHQEVHRRLDKAGFDPKKVAKELKGLTPSQRFEWLHSKQGALQKIDDWLGIQLK